MRKGIMFIGVILLVLSLILFSFAMIADHDKVREESFGLSESEQNGIQGSLTKGDKITVDFTSTHPVTVYIADADVSLDFADTVSILAEEVEAGHYTWEAPEDGEYAVMFTNDGSERLQVDVEVEYTRFLVEIFWMIGTILIAIGLGIMVAGAIMHTEDFVPMRSPMAATYKASPKRTGGSKTAEKASSKKMGGSKATGKAGKTYRGRDGTKSGRPVKGTPVKSRPRRTPKRTDADWDSETKVDPESRMPAFGANSFDSGSRDGDDDDWSDAEADGDNPEDTFTADEDTDGGGVKMSRPSDGEVRTGSAGGGTSSDPGEWASSGWDDFGDGTKEEAPPPEEEPEDEEEEEEKERPSEWLRKMLES